MGCKHGFWRLGVGLFVVLAEVGSTRREGDDDSGGQLVMTAVTVVGLVIMGAAEGVQEPLECWNCSTQTHGDDCYHSLNQTNITSTATMNCLPDQAFCMVKRTWYVVEGTEEEMNFSINRTCAAACSPYCLIIGDRTKIYSCVSCCTEPFCNTGSSGSSRPLASLAHLIPPVLLLTFLVPQFMIPIHSCPI